MAQTERYSVTPEAKKSAAQIFQQIRGTRIEDLPIIDNLHPYFRHWLHTEKIGDQLQCIALVIAGGVATDIPTAYQYLNNLVHKREQEINPQVTVSDTKDGYWSSWKTPIRTITGEHIEGIKLDVAARY